MAGRSQPRPSNRRSPVKARTSTASSSAEPPPDARPTSRVVDGAKRARQVAARSTNNLSVPSISVPALGDISTAAARIVNQAATILEEEVAAGILAARDVESRFIDVEEERAANAAELITRIRTDAHELIDILVDIVGVAGDRANSVVGRVISLRSADGEGEGGDAARRRGRAKASEAVSELAIPQPIAPGSSAQVAMVVENDGPTPTGRFRFHCSDLIGPEGARIGHEAVKFRPAMLALDPTSTVRMAVTVTVPEGTRSGSYSGVLQATKLTRLKAILSFEVA